MGLQVISVHLKKRRNATRGQCFLLLPVSDSSKPFASPPAQYLSKIQIDSSAAPLAVKQISH